ncbi:MAG: pseudouridine synthase [Bacteriovoracia bacterium]
MKRLEFSVPESLRGSRLDQALATWLPAELGREFSKSSVRKLIVAGAVYLNGKRVRIASKPLLPGAKLQVYLDEQKLKTPARVEFKLTPERVLFVDDAIIIVDKPAGVPTQPTLDDARSNLYREVQRYCEATWGAGAYVGLHHRLDRDTSGVILFTRDKAANSSIADQFASHTLQKTYVALCVDTRMGSARGRDPGRWVLKNHLKKSKGTSKRPAKMSGVKSGGDYAETSFHCLRALKLGDARVYLIEAQPRTGRMHQIRVHLAEHGLPILGDRLYGAPAQPAVPRILLHAARLEFAHPLKGERMAIESPVPKDFAEIIEGASP